MGILRRCAALLSATALTGTLLGVPAARADNFSRVDRAPVAGAEVVLSDGRRLGTSLFSLRVGARESVRAYAAGADEVRPHTAYVESAWEEAEGWSVTARPGDPADRARWIVSHSYPSVDLTELSADLPAVTLEEGQAIAATQAALWHVLDGVELDREAGNAPAVVALYDFLVEGSDSAPDQTAQRSLSVSPSHVEAVSPEEPLGPLEVSSLGGKPVDVSLSGAPTSWLVDGDGVQVAQAGSGDELYLDVDPSVPAGVVTVHLRGEGLPLPEGQLFTGRNGVRTQPLVTAEAGRATSTASATLTWQSQERPAQPSAPAPEAPEETPQEGPPVAAEAPEAEEPDAEVPSEAGDRNSDEDLPVTGTWLSGLLVIAGALLVSGLIILLLGRKRRE